MKRKARGGSLRPAEIRALARLLKKVPAVPNIPKELFLLIMQKNVPVTIDLAIERGKKILLTRRNDAYFKGWHFPGSFMSPGETIKQAQKRTALLETGLKIQKSHLLGVSNFIRGKRFHFVSFFFLCRVTGAPKDGAWFLKCPRNIIPEHKQLWRKAALYFRNNKIEPLTKIEEIA